MTDLLIKYGVGIAAVFVALFGVFFAGSSRAKTKAAEKHAVEIKKEAADEIKAINDSVTVVKQAHDEVASLPDAELRAAADKWVRKP